MAKKISNKKVYDENSIEVKEFPDNVRTRPTMYIGDLGIKGNTHLVKEVVDNSTDEAMNGFGKIIIVEISNKRGYCRVIDEGRGIPHLGIEKAFTKMHSSAKFNHNEYSVSGGLNGVK